MDFSVAKDILIPVSMQVDNRLENDKLVSVNCLWQYTVICPAKGLQTQGNLGIPSLNRISIKVQVYEIE